ncbi:MAG: OmpA family protein [Bacteroidales bacterium]|nr:OmpA family protein [Bacteroidales bacterium]
MKTTVLLPILMIIAIIVNAQRSKLEQAKQYKENYEFSKAIAIYEELHKKGQLKDPDVIQDAAQSYIMINDMESAQYFLDKINSLRVYKPQELMNYAYVLKTNAEYQAAVSIYKRIKGLFPHLSYKIPSLIESCYLAEEWMNNPQLYNVQNLSDINTPYSEFAITRYEDGYFFITDRKEPNKSYKPEEIFGWTGNPYLRIYHLPNLDQKEIHSEIDYMNTTFHNGPVVYDFKNKTLYITKTKRYKVKSGIVNSNPTEFLDNSDQEVFINRLELYSLEFVDGEWKNRKEFPYNNVERYSIGHPALSPDGKILYFVSDMPGSIGKSDIWYCERLEDGSWDIPKNAGSMINTEEKEMFPYVDSDGTLYFSSDGHMGMGGLDIFRAKGEKNKWSTPENLKYPINSPKDDFAPLFIIPGKIGYLSSNRNGGKGSDDIYFFAKQVNVVVRTYEKINNKNIIVPNVYITVEKNNEEESRVYKTDIYGETSFLTHYNEEMKITANHENYIGSEKIIKAAVENDTLYVDMFLDKIELNKTFVLENIYYDFDKWNIRSDAAIELDKLVKILKEHPEIDIELSSHTDSRGTHQYNRVLSQRRAESAVAYIISKGIDAKRIVAKGYGEEKLREPCPDGVNCTEAQHQLNRRTEFTITNIRKK